ncbi:MAG: alpha/beta hydrolase [Gemmatimonadales bacterium]|nr:alpha/beta hydrolase [Gemmatimonadales bacterium]
MLRSRLFLAGIAVLAACGPKDEPAPVTAATAGSFEPVTIPYSEARTLRSRFVDQEFKIFVALPPAGSGAAASSKYPVIYTLDANGEFGIVSEIARLAAFEPGTIPPALVVGIGYPVSRFEETLNLRTRDYTPTADTGFARFATNLWGNGTAPTPGGAPAFLRFIREELKPFIEQHYPADPADATLIGHSFGGLFASYALFHEPATFQRYVIASPSLWWDRQVSFEYEKQYAARNKDLPARVFLSVGGLESAAELRKSLAAYPDSMRAPILAYYEEAGYPQMVELLEPFAKALAGRRYPSLRMTSYIFPDETHASVMPMIASRGLRDVFRPAAP